MCVLELLLFKVIHESRVTGTNVNKFVSAPDLFCQPLPSKGAHCAAPRVAAESACREVFVAGPFLSAVYQFESQSSPEALFELRLMLTLGHLLHICSCLCPYSQGAVVFSN